MIGWKSHFPLVLVTTLVLSFFSQPLVVWGQAADQAAVLKSYRVTAEKLAGLTEVLQQLFEGQSNVRIQADRNNGNLVVSAPASTQSQIADFIERSGYAAAPSAPQMADNAKLNPPAPSMTVDTDAAGIKVINRQPAAGPVVGTPQSFQQTRDLGDGMVELEIKLSQISGEDLEQGIMQLMGQNLPISYSPEGALTMMTLPTDSPRKVSLQIYRKDGVAILRGAAESAQSWGEVIRAMDTPSRSESYRTSLVSLRNASRESVQEALSPFKDPENSLAKRQVFEALREVAGNKKLRWSGDLAAMIFQPGEDNEAAPAVDGNEGANPPVPPGGEDQAEVQLPAGGENPQITISPDEQGGLIGPVQIEFLEGLDVIVVRGHRRDVERITAIINDIERLSIETQPVIVVRELKHANSEAVAATVNELYENLLNARYGQVSITGLVKPNAILLIGREQSVQGILDLIAKLDQPVGPSKTVKVFKLSHLAAEEAQTKFQEFYDEPTGLGTRIRVSFDARSNALIVQASPRDMVEVEYIVNQIDVPKSDSMLEIRVIQLKNSLAEDLAPVLQDAITGTTTGQGGGQNANQAAVRSAMLSFMTLDTAGKRILESGILNEVTISADARSNALIIRAPDHSMELITALIKHLDSQPTAESQIKVFTVINGDATQLTTMLNELFQTAQSTSGGQNNFFQPSASSGESSLIPLNFSVDTRTNSIIASGSASDLTVVEAILLRLDQDEAAQRKSTVVRLRNARADLVAQSLTELLESESQLQTIDPSVVSPFQQLVREVIVVPELFSNSLIISATPQYFDAVLDIVLELDERPPMVMLQVLIADVRLNDFEELGFEFGLQDSFLFDRSVVANGTVDPGFNFNNQPLGNSSAANSIATRSIVASQGLTNFALGRVNPDLGYGGFVFSAASESVNVLIRALEREARLEVLARPQIMTMDNQPGFIQVGERVPRITSSQLTVNGTINTTELVNTGIILSVTPRISPDGVVVMAIQAERSAVGPEAEGIPISINQNGDVIRSPRFDTQTATAVVSARSGQTIVFGGLINNSTQVTNRQVPLLGDLPWVGPLFRYDSYDASRSELLIIITPIVVRNDEDAALLREQEMSRMSWCLADVAKVYGSEALYGIDPALPYGEGVIEIYPDEQPAAVPEFIPPGPSMRQEESPAMPVPAPTPALPNTDASMMPLPLGTQMRPAPAGEVSRYSNLPAAMQPANTNLERVSYDQYGRPAAYQGIPTQPYSAASRPAEFR